VRLETGNRLWPNQKQSRQEEGEWLMLCPDATGSDADLDVVAAAKTASSRVDDEGDCICSDPVPLVSGKDASCLVQVF